MPSFDIVSEIDLVEVRNATENATRELGTRFDFRGVNASFEFDDGIVTLTTESDFQLNQMMDILRSNCAKRHVDAASMETKDNDHTGTTHKRRVEFKQGIEQPIAKKLVKLLKDNKLKVQASIQGEQVRVTGKKRDDLQQAIALIKDNDLGQPFQFTNFRD